MEDSTQDKDTIDQMNNEDDDQSLMELNGSITSQDESLQRSTLRQQSVLSTKEKAYSDDLIQIKRESVKLRKKSNNEIH